MYYLFIISIITTIAVFCLKKYQESSDTYRNDSEYNDKYGNLVIETKKYIYKMSRYDGKLYRRKKGNTVKDYRLIYSQMDKQKINPLVKHVVLDSKSGMSRFIQ